MLIRRLSILLILAAPLVAQLSNNTVTVTASQSSTAQQPDEAVFSVTVGSGIDKSLDDAVAAVSSLGITAANLVNVDSPGFLCTTLAQCPQPKPTLQWIFQLTVPFSKLKDTTATLTALQKSISQNNSGLTLSFSLSGTRLSQQQAPTCNLAGLVSQARAQAPQIASAAGLTAGAIVGLTSFTPSICSLTVRFALGAMFGQPGPNITITAVRTNAIQPDQVLIGLSVQSGTTVGLDDVTSALTGAGIAGATFTGVYTTTYFISTGVASSLQTPQPELVWSFTLTAPLAKLSATLAQILSAQQAISSKNSGLTLNFFYVEGTQVSPQLQQSQTCPQAALLADVQAQAKQVATAAGVSAGAILSMGEGSSGVAALQVAPVYNFVPTQAIGFAGVLNSGGPGLASFLTPPVFPTPQPTCSLTVQFQLL